MSKRTPYSAVVSPSGPLRPVPAMKPTVDAWIESDPKIAEWHEETAKRPRETARNYSRLLHLYWQNNPRFRAFKSPGQWLREVEEQ